MATKQKRTKQSDMPDGFSEVEANQPEGALEIDVGESVVGRLDGIARQSKLNPDRRYRLITTKDGTFFLNGTAKLEQLGLMDFPVGTVVWLQRVADVPIEGQPSPMKDYRLAVRNGSQPAKRERSDNDLPF